MFPALNTALSALSADSTAIDVVGNNLANLNTTGFKASQVAFHDMISQTLGTANANGQVGMGLGQVGSVQQFTQGSLTTTNGPLDAALQGNGFFVVKDADNNQLYTRAGNFQLDASGNLRTSTGENVQGWTAVGGVVNTNGAVGNLTLPVGSVVAPAVTTKMSMNVNLNSQVSTTDTGAVFTTPIQVYDAQGTAHTLSVTFTKSAANTWGYDVTIPAADLNSGAVTDLGSGTLTFDGNGNLTDPPVANDPQVLTVSGLVDGAADFNVNWHLYDTTGKPSITQYSQASGMSNPSQDGTAAGQVSKITLQNNGLVVANYTNGRQVTLGQLAVASIANPTSLIQAGNNNLQASAATAQAAVGAAGSGGRGQIVGGALEGSTSDMALQFTQLLTYERSYQAASRVVTTSDQLLQETVNLIHG